MTSQWSPVSKSTILGRNVWVLVFLSKIVLFETGDHCDEFQKVLFWEEMYEF